MSHSLEAVSNCHIDMNLCKYHQNFSSTDFPNLVDKKRQRHRISANRVVPATDFTLRRGGRMSKRISLSISCTLIIFLLCAASLSAQRITGDISGDVTDASGAAIPNVVVTAVNSA